MDRRPGKGTAIVIRHTVEELRAYRDRFDVTLIHREHIPEDPLYKEFNEIIIPRVRLPKFSGFFSELWFFLSTRERFDVYYFSYSRLYPTFWLAPARRIVFAAMDGGPATSGYGDRAKGKQPWFVRLFLGRVNSFVALTEFGKRGIVETYGVPEDRVHIVPNGIDERFNTHIRGARSDWALTQYGIQKPYLLCVSRFDPHKNILRLLEAYKSALQACAVPEILVFVGGRHMPDYSALVDARIESLGLGANVVIAPYIPDEDLPAVYAGAVAMVFPSLYEGFGLPVIEAMAAGTPVIISDIAALTEVSGGHAEVVNPYDAAAIAKGICAVVSDEGYQNRLRKEGETWVRRYTWKAHGAAIAAVLSGDQPAY